MQETQEMQVQSLGWEDPLEEEMVTHKYSCLKNPMDRGACQAASHGVAKSQTRLSTHTHTHTHTHHVYYRNFVKFKIFLWENECKLIQQLWRIV